MNFTQVDIYGNNRQNVLETVFRTLETLEGNVDGRIASITEDIKAAKELKNKALHAALDVGKNIANAVGQDGVAGGMKEEMRAKQEGKNSIKTIRELFKADNLKKGGLAVVGAGTALFIAGKATWLGFGELEKYINTPDLIDETSLPQNMYERIFGKEQKISRLEDFMAPDHIKERLSDLIEQTQNAKATGQTFKNILCYGPPGTGKTMFSKIIASESGLEFCMFSGANFKKFGKIEQAVTELEKIIKWARTCKKGLLIFVDEAEMLFAARDTPDATPESIALTLKFLAMVDKPSDSDLMWVFASNHRGAIDTAIESRISESFEFQLPSKETAVAMFLQYLNKFDIFVDESIKQSVFSITHLFEGTSGRDIEETAKDISRLVFINNKPLSFDLIKKTIELKRLKNETAKKEQEKYQISRYGRKISH